MRGGDIFNGWELDTWATYTRAEEIESIYNGVSRARLQQGLLVNPLTGACFDTSNGCVPVNIFGEGNISAEAAKFSRITAMENTTERTQILATAILSGSPFELWAGDVEFAFGAEWRSDESHYEAGPYLFTGDALGYRGTSSVDGTERVAEFYAETLVPLAVGKSWADYLAVEAAARYSKYDNAGGVWTYKYGGEWSLFPGLVLRAMQQRSVRAPNNSELFTQQLTEPGIFVASRTSLDPCSASADPVGRNNVEKCILQGLDPSLVDIFEATSSAPTGYIMGGNLDLKPEVAETLTFGGVFQPEELPGWTFSIDYFDLDISDTIGDIDPTLICFDPKNSENIFCSNIVRDGTSNVIEVEQLTSNRGVLQTRGVDVQVRHSMTLPSKLSLFDGYADLSSRVIWTHMMENTIQADPVTTLVDCAGRYGWPCNFPTLQGVLPEEKVTAFFNYSSGPLTVHLSWRWIGQSHNAAQIGATFFNYGQIDPAIKKNDPKNYLDLGMAWDVKEDVTVRFGINNLTDTQPPNIADQAFGNNTTPQHSMSSAEATTWRFQRRSRARTTCKRLRA